MLEFCKACKSIKFKGSCTNKKCKYHVQSIQPVTFRQMEYIKDMLRQLEDETEYDFVNMTKKEASELISELEERLELGD